MYIRGMANKKRDINGYRKQLGRYRLNRSDILAIEKMLWIYADALEMKHAGILKPFDGRRHMPRAAVDRYVSIGRYSPFYLSFRWNEFGINYAGVNWIYREDSTKFISKYIQKTRYLELAAWPGIKVTFTPLTTIIYAQTHYATGRELKAMKDVIALIENYLSKHPESYLNSCKLTSVLI
jgi:hypothetical protein